MNNILLKPLFEKKADPLTLLLRDIFKDNKYAMSYLGALSIGLGFSQINTLSAEETDSTVEEISLQLQKEQLIFKIFLWQFKPLVQKN